MVSKLVWHIFKYLFCPYLLSLAVFALFLTVGEVTSGAMHSIYSYLLQAAILALIFWVPFFVTISVFIGLNEYMLWARKKDKDSAHVPNFRLPIKTRLVLKNYLLLISIAMFFLLAALYVNSIQLSGELKLSVEEFPVFFTVTFVGFLAFYGYFSIYHQEEKAIYFLDRFLRKVGLLDDKNRKLLSSKDFQVGIKAYEKSLLTSAYSLKDTKSITKRIDLVLDRGTADDLSKLQTYLYKILSFIKLNDHSSFDSTFSEFGQFLAQVELAKASIIQINTSARESISISIKKALSENIGKILVGLIPVFIVLLAWFWGIKLPSF